MSIRNLFYGIAVLISLLAVQTAFYFFQRSESLRVLDGITAIFRTEEVGANPFRISAELMDLARRGSIRCPSLIEKSNGKVYLERRDLAPCEGSFWTLPGSEVFQSIPSINGIEWNVSFLAPNSYFFYVSLWVSRFLALMVIGVVTFIVRNASLKIQNERKIAFLEKQNSDRIETFSKQVAHDLRSPLSAIGILVQRAKISDDEKSIMRNAYDRLNGIADNVLAWSKDKSGQVRRCDLAAIIHTALEEKKAEFSARKDLSLNFISGGPQVFGKINELEFSRLISNLLNNSAQACAGMGRQGAITIHLIANSNTAVFKIKDNGAGIPRELLGKLGEKGASFRNGDQRGSGLGLYHAKSNIEAWGGQLTIHSVVGEGTEISIALPIDE